MILTINNIKLFHTYITTIIKFIPTVELEVTKTETRILAKNESRTRCVFSTNTMVINSEEKEDSVEFCLWSDW